MVASNERDPAYFGETARILRDAADMVEKACGITIDFLNLGGGFGLNYKLEDEALDPTAAAREIKAALQGSSRRVFTENGRFVTGPNGYLLTRVRYVMQKYKTYVGVDASMHNLMRPGMYGAYHHITVLGKEGSDAAYDVVGSLCENNDKFAIDRNLPHIEPGDLLVVHDAGAHGHAMGFNYNGLLRSAEVLIRNDGTFELIRQAETIDDYLRNVIF
jgi:diaminopimelate decarboxylase